MEEGARMNDALRPLYEVLAADSNPIPAKWLTQRIGG
jgi:dihydrodipicolinate synthase/N-acetylneuraminate lyase